MLLASCKARAVEPPCSPLLGLLCCYGRLPPEGKDQESVIGFFFFFFSWALLSSGTKQLFT